MSSEFRDYIVEDILSHIPNISSRAMFGGYAIYKDGIVFALIVYDELYFKVDDSNINYYKEIDSHPFVYKQKEGKEVTMSYWLIPEDIFYDKYKIAELIEESVSISLKKNK